MTDYKQLCAELIRTYPMAWGPSGKWRNPEQNLALERARAALAEPEPDGLPIWTEGIYGDGAVFLKDGVMVPIEEVVRELNRGAQARAALAEPEPEGPTDEELAEVIKQSMEDCIFISELLYYNREPFMQILRSVLARWGNHPGSPDSSAQPELYRPSFSDVMEWASGIEPWATWLAPGGCLENAHFEFDRLVTAAVARWGSSQGILDSSTLQPVPVSERLPGDELCWWYELDEDDGYGGMWTLLRIRGGTTRYTHWLPAHALPLPSSGEGEA